LMNSLAPTQRPLEQRNRRGLFDPFGYVYKVLNQTKIT
jgi:hypothetical protein